MGRQWFEIFKNICFEEDLHTAYSELTLQSDCLELFLWIALHLKPSQLGN